MIEMEPETGNGTYKEKRFMNTFSVKDRVMVITGGTNGIGRGRVLRLKGRPEPADAGYGSGIPKVV